MMKLSRLPSPSQRSIHVSLWCSRLSLLVHWPCLDCCKRGLHAVGSQQAATFSSRLLPCAMWVSLFWYNLMSSWPSHYPRVLPATLWMYQDSICSLVFVHFLADFRQRLTGPNKVWETIIVIFAICYYYEYFDIHCVVVDVLLGSLQMYFFR